MVSAATAALGIEAASFGGDGEDGGGDGGAKDTAESPTALPERPKKNHKTCEASAKHLSTKRHQSGTKRFFHERAPIGHETLIRERARIGHETLIRERTRIGHETLIHEKDTNRTRKGF